MKKLLTNSLVSILVVVLVFTVFMALQLQAEVISTDEKININTASVKELQELPQIGEKVAQRIIDFREKEGKFEKIEELMKVNGIGEKTFDKLKELITV